MTSIGKRRSSTPAIEWPTVFLTLFCYSVWLVAGFLVWPSYPILALAILAFTAALQLI